jgi:predicted GH43/DUF377 family glycosyl hydrolase
MNTAFQRGLGVALFDEKIFICYQTSNNSPNTFNVDYSKDGKEFIRLSDNASLEASAQDGPVQNISLFRFTKTQDVYNMYYLSEFEGKKYLEHATSQDFTSWHKAGRLFPITEAATQIPYYDTDGKQIIFFGGNSLNIGLSTDGKVWNIKKVDMPEGKYIVGNVKETEEGPLLVYFHKTSHEEHNHFSLFTVLLDKKDPTKVLWKTDKAFWYQPQEWINKKVEPIGIVDMAGTFYSYWELPGKEIYCVIHNDLEKYANEKSLLPHAELIRHVGNPILTPKEENIWETKQVFNAAAVYHKDAVHILYRAVGDHETSVLGYAVSRDGLTIDERSEKPAYVPRAKFEHPSFGRKIKIKPSPFESGGGGYGGIEDPRITRIDDKFYLTYVAYDGTNPPRIALSYISVKNFEKKNWKKWSDPVLISPPGVVDKNACILPEKIDGKYVIFHRIYPDILIDKVDDLDFDGESNWLKGEERIHPRPDFWDSNKVGMGPPPIKTKKGWLAIYQGIGFQDNSRYKIGAMLLDLKDPSKVLHRCTHPILEPETFYENGGCKAGVVYPCGAVVIENTLIVYYGGSDTFLAVATADLDQFMDELMFDNSPHLDPVTLDTCVKLNAEINKVI